MKYLTRFFLTGFFVFFLAFFTTRPALAMEFRSSEKDIVVSENEMIVGSLFATGNTIDINGAVEGDLFCAGQSIIVKGSVGGDVLCAGQTIRIDGTVGGNVRTIGQAVDINGTVSRNVMLMGQTVTVGKESVIEGEGIFGGQSVSILGEIGKSIAGGGNSMLIDGTIGGDAMVGGNAIQVGSGANIAGKLTYESDKDPVISDTAVVGEVAKQPLRKELRGNMKPQDLFPKRIVKPWPINAIQPMLVSIVFGLLIVFLFKNKTKQITDIMKERALGSFGVGILWLIVFPILFILLCLTIIGIPIAILYALLFGLVLCVSRLFVAFFIGKEIVTSFWKEQENNQFAVVCIGVVVSWLLFAMPLVGGLISFLAVLWGTGGIVKSYFLRKQVKKTGK